MPAGYGAAPRPGETGEQYEAEQRVLEQRHAVDEARARLDQLEKTSTANQNDIQKARNDLLKAQGDQNAAELRLYQEQTKQLEGHAHETERLGAEIDKDFGISKGLSGIVDNLTKFLGNLMMAGPLAALSHIVDASGVRQNAPGAGGLLGMAAVSGAFGPQFMPGAAAAGGVPQGPFGGFPGIKTPSLGSVNSVEEMSAAGGRVGALYALAASLQGTPYSTQLRNDCSGMVSELANVAVGLPIPGAGSRFSTANEGDWLMSHGFQSGMGGPDDLNIGWHIGGPGGGHTAATLPGGVNAEQGGANPAFTLGPGAAGASNPEFEYHAHLPMGALQGPGVTPGAPMTTDASGAVMSPSAFRPRGSDTIPAMLSPGEEVARTAAVHTYGASTYEAMNKGLIDPTSIRYLSGGTDSALEPGQTQGPTQIGGGPASAGYGSGMPGASSGAMGAGADLVGGAPAPHGSGIGMAAPMGGAAAGAAAGAASMGIGLAAQIAMQEAQRAIQYAGTVGGIAEEGLLETVLPTGASQLAQNSWLTKIAGGLMGAQPQIPNMAGKSQNKSPEGVLGIPQSPETGGFGPTPASVVPAQLSTPESVTQSGQAAPPQGVANGSRSGDDNRSYTGLHIENYHGNSPDKDARDLSTEWERHTVATNGPSRGTSQWA